MKIAVTGGAGFVGSHLVRAYLDAGHDVLVLDSLVHGSRQAVDPRARFYHVDIRDSRLQTILQTERPDVVSHHAAQREHIKPGEQALIDADVQIRGLLNVLDACVNASVSKIIFASGGNTLYGCTKCVTSPTGSPSTVSPLKESAPPCPGRPCDISKIAGEWYVRYYTCQYGLPHTILRYADIYGESDRAFFWHPLAYFIVQLAENLRPVIRGSDRDIRDHIFIDDVVQANLRALEHGRNETMHISSGQGYSLRQFYMAAARLLHSDIAPTYISSPLSAESSAIVLDNTLARRVLRWQPEINFDTGIKLAAERLCGPTRRPAPRERLDLEQELPVPVLALAAQQTEAAVLAYQ